jgi:type II secretory pathway component GspD/PulD (secretin)
MAKGRKWLIVGVFVAVWLLLGNALVNSEEAAEAPAGPPPISNVFFDTDIRQALQDIASQAEVNIIPGPDVTGLVTCDLKNLPLDKALQMVLAGTGYTVKKMPDYYLVCSSDPSSASFPLISETRLIKLNYVKAETALKLISPGFKNYVQADTDKNHLCITAPEKLMGRIVDDVKMTDQPPRQILLDARIVVLESSDLLNLGLKWNWPQAEAGIYSESGLHGDPDRTGANWPWAAQIGYTPSAEFTNSLLLTLSLLRQNDDATVIANPQVMVQDSEQAEINVTTEEYFKILTEEAYYVRSTLEKIEVGTTLTITPRVGENEEITLRISTEVSDVVARGEDNLPVVTRRKADSVVRVENGGTAAVAGLVDNRTRISHSRVPGLGAIPLLGRPFRNDSNGESSRQVAVFITARLVPEGGPAAIEPAPKRLPIPPVGEEFKEALAASLARRRQGGE